MSQALYRKYRPKAWAEVLGQDHVVQTLRNALAADRISHAYLFAGPRGTGKTTVARLLAKAANCLAEDRSQRPCNSCENCRAINESRYLDLIEMDAASNNGVDEVRDLREKIGFAPSQGTFKVYIIDEVHMLSGSAFNALLKTLEEPPSHAIFILATTEIHKIPPTVVSRCQRHEFRRVSVDEIAANLKVVSEREGFEADEAALLLIARQATGSIRDAQSLLDQLASRGSRITLELAQVMLGTTPTEHVFDLVDALRDGRSEAALETLRRALNAGADPRTLARQVVEYLRGVMLVQLGNAADVEATKDAIHKMAAHAKALTGANILRLTRIFSQAASDTRLGWQPSLALELAVVEAVERPVESPIANSSPLRIEESSSRLPNSHPHASAESRQGSAAAPRAASPSSLHETSPRARPQADTNGLRQGPPAESAPDRTEGTVDLAAVAAAWRDIRAAVKPEHPGVEALLNSCKPIEVSGNQLVLGFQSDTVRALMDKRENLEATRRAVAAVLGANLTVKCVVINARGKLPRDAASDGMVSAALDHGGEIVDVQE